jgi:hypothetical protein
VLVTCERWLPDQRGRAKSGRRGCRYNKVKVAETRKCESGELRMSAIWSFLLISLDLCVGDFLRTSEARTGTDLKQA